MEEENENGQADEVEKPMEDEVEEPRKNGANDEEIELLKEKYEKLQGDCTSKL